MRVGSELKAARKKAGISVEVISKRTNIKVSKLVALEKNDFKNLPTGLYLFSTVRAYAREVHIDPEPIVERLRAEFADKDALDALQALDATGALAGKTNAGRSKEEQSNHLRKVAIAAGVVLMAAAGAGAGVYLHKMGRSAGEVRSIKVERPSGEAEPIVNPPKETPPVPLSSPPPPTTIATKIDVPQQPVSAARRAAPTKTRRAKPRAAPAESGLQEAVETIGTVSDALGSPANIEELKPEPPALATAP
jgi:cytoskeleton protein RodZ